MVRTIALMFSVPLMFTACGTITVDREELDRRIITNQYQVGTVSVAPNYLVRYMGSDDEFHYIHHRVDKKERTYRIRHDQFFVLGRFPRTDDESEWKVLLRRGERWPPEYHRLYEDLQLDLEGQTILDLESPF